MRTLLVVLVAAFLLTSVAGCATTAERHDLVMRQAEFDLSCARQSIRISELGGRVYGARGCGQQQTYVMYCYDTNIGSCTVRKQVR
jgi:hypothetical protein